MTYLADEPKLCPGVHALPRQGQTEEVGHHGHPETGIQRRQHRQVDWGENRHPHQGFQTA